MLDTIRFKLELKQTTRIPFFCARALGNEAFVYHADKRKMHVHRKVQTREGGSGGLKIGV